MGAMSRRPQCRRVSAGLGVSRPVLVARLLELDAAGALTTAHVRADAHVGGVTVRTGFVHFK
ncbi:predicted protein [Streptomyces iranensis]|uniref:Uncharacterized protein n=2 Tax=Streptomyces iranensis TaxID=576784 RepID=A0A061A5T4_9ACTN|nr:predicted protein [Streptomyces iranensis]